MSWSAIRSTRLPFSQRARRCLADVEVIRAGWVAERWSELMLHLFAAMTLSAGMAPDFQVAVAMLVVIVMYAGVLATAWCARSAVAYRRSLVKVEILPVVSSRVACHQYELGLPPVD